jgi:hypothetical protein
MNVLFCSLDETLDLHRLLDDEGWRLQELGPGRYRGRHPEVEDQGSAREHLDRVGLLTSKRVSIEIRPR